MHRSCSYFHPRYRFILMTWNDTPEILSKYCSCHTKGGQEIINYRVFSALAPSLWNRLLVELLLALSLTTFKRVLKTTVFTEAS